jgi:hypothetical protein
MSGCYRNPGPLCQMERPVSIDSGTSCLIQSPSPAPQLDLFLTSVAPDFVRTLEQKWQCDDDVRSEIVRVARNYVGSLKWREDQDGVVKCSRFIDDILGEVFGGALGHHLQKPPRIGGWRGLIARTLEIHTEDQTLQDLGTWIRAGRKNPPLAGDWAARWIDIPMWDVVEGEPAAAQPGDIVSEQMFYWDASGHVGIVVGPSQTASADSTASPPGKVTVSDYGFRSDSDAHKYGHAKDCTIRRFACHTCLSSDPNARRRIR